MCYNSLCSLLTCNKLLQHYSVTQMQVTASDSSADFPLLTLGTFLLLDKYNKVEEVIFHVQQHICSLRRSSAWRQGWQRGKSCCFPTVCLQLKYCDRKASPCCKCVTSPQADLPSDQCLVLTPLLILSCSPCHLPTSSPSYGNSMAMPGHPTKQLPVT